MQSDDNPSGVATGANLPPPDARGFEELKLYIAERLHEPLTVDTLARRYGCSPFHFARLFRKVIGQPPHDYIIDRRLEKAKEMLEWTELSIGEITRRIGFGTQAHFSATFRERVGMTPTAYRAMRAQAPKPE